MGDPLVPDAESIDIVPDSKSLADVGITFADIVGKVANVALKIDRTVEGVDAVLGPFAAFIPYYAQAIAVAKIADPIIAKVAAAAPVVGNAIAAERPLIEAVQAQAPAIERQVRDILSVIREHSPVELAPVTAETVKHFAGTLLAGTSLEAIFKASEFAPQDPRFARAQGLPG